MATDLTHNPKAYVFDETGITLKNTQNLCLSLPSELFWIKMFCVFIE